MKTNTDIISHFKNLGVFGRLEAHLIRQISGGIDVYHREKTWFHRTKHAAIGFIVATFAILAWRVTFAEPSLQNGLVTLICGALSLLAWGVHATGFGGYKQVQGQVNDFQEMLRMTVEADDTYTLRKISWPQGADALTGPWKPVGVFLQNVGLAASEEVSQIENRSPEKAERREKLKALLRLIALFGTMIEDMMLHDLPPAYQNAEWHSPFQWPGKQRRVRSAGAIASMV